MKILLVVSFFLLLTVAVGIVTAYLVAFSSVAVGFLALLFGGPIFL